MLGNRSVGRSTIDDYLGDVVLATSVDLRVATKHCRRIFVESRNPSRLSLIYAEYFDCRPLTVVLAAENTRSP